MSLCVASQMGRGFKDVASVANQKRERVIRQPLPRPLWTPQRSEGDKKEEGQDGSREQEDSQQSQLQSESESQSVETAAEEKDGSGQGEEVPVKDKDGQPQEGEKKKGEAVEKNDGDKDVVAPKAGSVSPHKPSAAVRDPFRHAPYPGRPPYPNPAAYPPHHGHMHNGYPGSEADMYHYPPHRYPPHMYNMPPGYARRSSPGAGGNSPHPGHRPRLPASEKAPPREGPDGEKGLPLLQPLMMSRNSPCTEAGG